MTTKHGKKQEKYSAFTAGLQQIAGAIERQDSLSGVFLFGANDFLLHKSANFVVEKFQKKNPEYPLTKSDFKELNQSSFLDLFSQASLFDEGQLIRVDRADQGSQLSHYLESLSGISGKFVVLTYGKARLAKHLIDQLQRLGLNMLEVAAPPPYKTAQYISQAAKQYRLKLNEAACQRLYQLIGHDLAGIENELRRLQLLFHGTDTVIDEKVISEKCQLVKEEDAFALSDCLMSGQRAKLDALLFRLLQSGTQPISLIGIVARTLRNASYLQNQSTNHLVRLPPSIKQKYVAYSRKLSQARIRAGLTQCAIAEGQCKSSKVDSFILMSELMDVLELR